MCKYCCVVLLILCLFSFSCLCLCFCLCFCLCLCIWLCWFICLFFCTSLQSNDEKTIVMASHPFASHILFLNKFLVSKKRFSWFWLLTSTWSLVMLIFSSKSPGFLNNWPPEMKKYMNRSLSWIWSYTVTVDFYHKEAHLWNKILVFNGMERK